MKHDMLQSEVQRSAQKMKPGDMEDHHKHEDLKNKVDNYGRKVGDLVEERALQKASLIFTTLSLYEPRYEKNGFLHKRKQRRRSASR